MSKQEDPRGFLNIERILTPVGLVSAVVNVGYEAALVLDEFEYRKPLPRLRGIMRRRKEMRQCTWPGAWSFLPENSTKSG